MELRQDYKAIEALYESRRTPDRIIAHYALERTVADELRNSTRAERDAGLYQSAYDRLLNGLPDHPRKTLHSGDRAARMQKYVERQAAMLAREVSADDVFMELGGGDCRVALLVAPRVAKSIVVDVSDALAPETVTATNFEFVKSFGIEIPLPSESVTFIYSNQLMEHLHPEDAMEQLREVFRVLKPGGRYLCRTPSRITGPHDVSMFFSDVAQGMHLKEYSYKELHAALKQAGFARLRVWIAPRAFRAFTLPQFAAEWIEACFAAVPQRFHTKVCRSKVARALLGITMMAEKPKTA
jgi:ubiquinone/menaquinone biosynthesis C-methylase UbiE